MKHLELFEGLNDKSEKIIKILDSIKDDKQKEAITNILLNKLSWSDIRDLAKCVGIHDSLFKTKK